MGTVKAAPHSLPSNVGFSTSDIVALLRGLGWVFTRLRATGLPH